jgi:hypothetical protein
MKIYTKKGDQGHTGLIGGTRVSKGELRIEAYGTVDELNSYVGLIRSFDINTNSVYAPTGAYKPPHQFPFRCTDSMLFRVEFLKKMRRTAFPFRECLDWELNYQLGSNGGVALWVEPHLVEQGTVKGRMLTTLPA